MKLPQFPCQLLQPSSSNTNNNNISLNDQHDFPYKVQSFSYPIQSPQPLSHHSTATIASPIKDTSHY